jgi:hypothetical protein
MTVYFSMPISISAMRIFVGVNNTGEKLIVSVADSGDKHKLANIIQIRNDPYEMLKGPEETDS